MYLVFQEIICDLRIYPLEEESENVSELCSFVEPSCELLTTASEESVTGQSQVSSNGT